MIKGQFGRVYKLIFVDTIETACYTNLCLFSVVRLKFGSNEIVNVVASLSGVITLILLLVLYFPITCIPWPLFAQNVLRDVNTPLKGSWTTMSFLMIMIIILRLQMIVVGSHFLLWN